LARIGHKEATIDITPLDRRYTFPTHPTFILVKL
jgi:hypothetical protein